MPNKYPKWLVVVLKEMFRRVHKRFTYKAIEGDEWYMANTWTYEEEKEFAAWLKCWLDANWKTHRDEVNWEKSMPAERKRAIINHFLLMHGWRYK